MKGNALLFNSIGIILLFSLSAFFFTAETYTAIERLSLWVRSYFGHFYLYLGLGCVLLLFVIAFSPLGRIRLGKANEKPEHSLWAWTSMLYSAGMGAGLLLRAVQEPIFMQRNPPYPSALTPETLALEYTFYQWGFTAWAFYGIFAMVVGYGMFVLNKKVLVSATIESTIRSSLVRNSIDIITIIATVFGLIAAIGLGTTQINGGLNHLLSQDFGLDSTLLLTALISAAACYSAWQGVNKGIKILSKLNILITLGLLVIVFVSSDMVSIVLSFFITLGHYLVDFIPMSLALEGFDPGTAFLTDWTYYYWAFWLAWAPFTGIFIARISKGRTLRQMLLGVLVIPSLGTFFWFSVFGTSAFQMVSAWSAYEQQFDNVFTSIFIFFQNYPMATLLNVTTVFLLVSFLVTSVDSAVYVLSMFTDHGKKNPAKKYRILWAGFILLATMALIILGNQKPEVDVLVAAQKLLIITSLPFALFMVVMLAIFLIGLRKKVQKPHSSID